MMANEKLCNIRLDEIRCLFEWFTSNLLEYFNKYIFPLAQKKNRSIKSLRTTTLFQLYYPSFIICLLSSNQKKRNAQVNNNWRKNSTIDHFSRMIIRGGDEYGEWAKQPRERVIGPGQLVRIKGNLVVGRSTNPWLVVGARGTSQGAI